jgi:CheY-like chemotaxis protein
MRILWLDNDRIFIRPLLRRLRGEGHVVDHVTTAAEALSKLAQPGPMYDVIILDVMLSVTPEDEAHGLSAGATNSGRQAGLVFYRRFLAPNPTGPRVVVLTIREDAEIREAFSAAGLPVRQFRTKGEVADPQVLVTLLREFCKGDETQSWT